MKKIGIVSDLHLEASNFKLNCSNLDCLIIAGDLSADLDLLDYFFAYNAPQNIPIIYVLGNHEYEKQKLSSAVKNIKNLLSPFENVHVLDNESIIIDHVKFIGSTLWTNFELDGIENKEKAMEIAKHQICDFSYILDVDQNNRVSPLTPQKMASLNKEAYDYIAKELKENPYQDGETIVVTHFAPHKNSIHNEYKDKGKQNSYWINHFEELMGLSQYWVHGHTHHSFDYSVKGTRVICNPRGYSRIYNISANTEFNPQLSISIEDKKVLKNKKITNQL